MIRSAIATSVLLGFLLAPPPMAADDDAGGNAIADDITWFDSRGGSGAEQAGRIDDRYKPSYNWSTADDTPAFDDAREAGDSNRDYGMFDFDYDYGDTEQWYERGDWYDYDLKSEGEGFNSWYDE